MTLKEQLFSFQGRLNRQPWWIINLAMWVIVFGFQIVAGIMMGTGADPSAPPTGGGLIAIVILVLAIVCIWISLALNVKRFHDRDKSGWWVLIIFVPIIGSLWILIECGFLPGTPGDNRFGGNPAGA